MALDAELLVHPALELVDGIPIAVPDVDQQDLRRAGDAGLAVDEGAPAVHDADVVDRSAARAGVGGAERCTRNEQQGQDKRTNVEGFPVHWHFPLGQLALYIRAMKNLDAILSIVLFALLTGAAAPAFPAQPESREEALRFLASQDAVTRAEAVVWIANRGGMADAALLHERLRDESGLVRSYAEQGLWLLWTRSGDSGIDRQMAGATELMQAGQYDEAISVLSQVVKKKPDFAEGWNRRATVYYLAGEYQKSIADCDEVLRAAPP